MLLTYVDRMELICSIDINKISVYKEYEILFPAMPKAEFEGFVRSIKDHGLRKPIEINSKDEILDGHHRFKACKLLGFKKIEAVQKHFKNRTEERFYIRIVNGIRRHLTKAQQIESALKEKPELEKLVRLNESRGGMIKGKGVQDYTPLGRVNEVIGKKIGGDSATQVHQMETRQYVSFS